MELTDPLADGLCDRTEYKDNDKRNSNAMHVRQKLYRTRIAFVTERANVPHFV